MENTKNNNTERSLKSELITEGENFKVTNKVEQITFNIDQTEQQQEKFHLQLEKEEEESKKSEKQQESQSQEQLSQQDDNQDINSITSHKLSNKSSQNLSIEQKEQSSEEYSRNQSQLLSKQQSSQENNLLFKKNSIISASIQQAVHDAIIKDKESLLQGLKNKIYESKLQPINYYQNIMEDVKCMWRKPFRIGHPAAGHLQYDDWFLLKGSSNHKLHSLKVRNWSKEGFLCYFQAIYKLADGTIIPGNEVYWKEGAISRTNEQNYEIESTFTLDDDEYAVEIIGKAGAWTDRIGVVTNKGRKWEHGGNGGCAFRLVAPKGFHFATFGANSGKNCDIHCIYFDIQIVPSLKDTQKYKLPLSEMRPVIKLIFDFLQFSDIVKMFLICKEFANYRYDEYVIMKIAEKIIYQCEVQSRQYLTLLIESSDLTSKLNKHLVKIKNLLELTENKIRNPDGEFGFDGFTEIIKGGNGINIQQSMMQNYHKYTFVTSFSYGILGWKKELKEVFTQEFIQEFHQGKAAIIAGCYMRANVFGSLGFIELNFYENNNIVAKDNLNLDSLTDTYKKYSLKYIHDVYSAFKPTTIELRVGGKDKKYWAGYYGALIASIFCHGLVIQTQEQKDFIYRL